MDNVKVFSGTRIYVEMLKEILENNDIPCLINTGNRLPFDIYPGGALEVYDLYVNASDAEKAIDLCSFIENKEDQENQE